MHAQIDTGTLPDFHSLVDRLVGRAQMAWDALHMRPTAGIPSRGMNVMQIALLEEIARARPGDYAANPEAVYLACQKNLGACSIDQFIPRNPLSMSDAGYDERARRGATTGADRIELDGLLVDSPEAVAEHLERFVFPTLAREAAGFDSEDSAAAAALIRGEIEIERRFAPEILKMPYSAFYDFPTLLYGRYGYANFFMAYALFPELMERLFRLQADLAEKKNRLAARAIVEGRLPRVLRLDHDMADSRGTLVDVASLDRLWFPHFARAVRPFLDAGIRLLWHCDGNLMRMVPRLIEAGVGGFQGFQYEDGMDYPAICRMTDREDGPLQIWAGVSVTTTLPHGTPEDVRRELRFLVENGPPVGLFLGASSSVTPGAKRENVLALIEGLRHYREEGR